MAERLTMARPYAEAIFNLAREQNRLKPWSGILGLILAVLSDDDMARIVEDPAMSDDHIVGLIKDICGDAIDEYVDRLLRLLLENNRLPLFPEIVFLFNKLRADAESTVEVEVRTAYLLEKPQEKMIAKALEKKLGCTVTLHVIEDRSLMGGVVIRAGDLVIDGSVRGYLGELASHLTH